ncbi:MAG TPA: hypothetical protein VGR28_06850 [Candidatus Thermoplasmatota archaeon]|jgi:hypothetical protein|nr:hypothetical protein [Candidatus Thermoplasmatota archaeon]
MTLSSVRAARRARLDEMAPAARVALYGRALDAWTCELEQREIGRGATAPQARLNVRERHEAGLREGYPAHVKTERDAFLDRHVTAALA